jgi:Arc/MetJ-type ribon-helix-helix transcriptional regulator
MTSSKNFQHVSVRFPAPLKKRIDEQHARTGATSVSAVVRSELDEVLATSRPPRRYLSQAATAPLTSLWLPRAQVALLRERAQSADVRLCDFIVTVMTSRPLDGGAGN